MSRTRISCAVVSIAVLAAGFPFMVAPYAAQAAQAHEQEGVVVSATMGKLVMTDTDGKQHTHVADDMTKVTIHGKPAVLEALKLGMRIRATLDEKNKLLTVATIDDVKADPRLTQDPETAHAVCCLRSSAIKSSAITESSAPCDVLRF